MPHKQDEQRVDGIMNQPWMTRFNTRQESEFNFREGVVDEAGEHVKLYYRLSNNPVAVVAYDKRAGFCVQLFIEQFVGEVRPKIARATRIELQRCLQTSDKEDPWAAVRQPILAAEAALSRFRWTWPPQRKT